MSEQPQQETPKDEEVVPTVTNIMINYLNGGFSDFIEAIGYQVSHSVIVIYDKQNTSHIIPLSTIQNVTITSK
jgi:hypothetical protein